MAAMLAVLDNLEIHAANESLGKIGTCHAPAVHTELLVMSAGPSAAFWRPSRKEFGPTRVS